MPKGPDDEKAWGQALEELVQQQRSQGSEIHHLRDQIDGIRELLNERCPQGTIGHIQSCLSELRGENNGRGVFWGVVATIAVACAGGCTTSYVYWSGKADAAEREAAAAREQLRGLQAARPEHSPSSAPVDVTPPASPPAAGRP